MLGAIVGDIIGSPYEWKRIKTLDFELFKDNGDQICMMTDDSVLALATAAAIIDNYKNPDFEKFYRKFVMENRYAGYGSTFFQWAFGQETIPSYGNGSAMRVSPVGWAYNQLEDIQYQAARSAYPSHGHTEGIKGAVAIATAIYLARTGTSKKGIKQQIESRFGYDINESIASVRNWYKMDETCQGTVPYAIRCFYESTDFENAIRLAVSLAGDSDTLGAIVGSIAEAYYGIPNEIADEALKFINKNYPNLLDYFNTFYKKYVKRA